MFLDSEEGCVPRKKIRIRSYPMADKKTKNLEIKISSIEGRFKKQLNINESNYPLSDIIVSSNNILNSCHLINLENIKLIDIYDINGRRVNSYRNYGNKELKFDTSVYQAGIYFIIVYTNQFKKKTIKIIIE